MGSWGWIRDPPIRVYPLEGAWGTQAMRWPPAEGNPGTLLPSWVTPCCPTLPPLPRKTLQLSRQLKDQAVEAQACYSLGNTYTLLQDYERAAEYHLRHLLIAQELADRCAAGMRAVQALGGSDRPLGPQANHSSLLAHWSGSEPRSASDHHGTHPPGAQPSSIGQPRHSPGGTGETPGR